MLMRYLRLNCSVGADIRWEFQSSIKLFCLALYFLITKFKHKIFTKSKQANKQTKKTQKELYGKN
jgi:hypothetical protein